MIHLISDRDILTFPIFLLPRDWGIVIKNRQRRRYPQPAVAFKVHSLNSPVRQADLGRVGSRMDDELILETVDRPGIHQVYPRPKVPVEYFRVGWDCGM